MDEFNLDFLSMLKVLAAHKVDFIVVGGVSAVVQGAPVATFDLDIVHARTPENVNRLLAALGELDARYRSSRQPPLRPDESRLMTSGHQLLSTRAGPLDILGAVGRGRSFEDLVGQTQVLELEGLQVRVLDLAVLIAVKEEVGGEKDDAVLPILRRTLRERERG